MMKNKDKTNFKNKVEKIMEKEENNKVQTLKIALETLKLMNKCKHIAS